jgi:hypothetical protein
VSPGASPIAVGLPSGSKPGALGARLTSMGTSAGTAARRSQWPRRRSAGSARWAFHAASLSYRSRPFHFPPRAVTGPFPLHDLSASLLGRGSASLSERPETAAQAHLSYAYTVCPSRRVRSCRPVAGGPLPQRQLQLRTASVASTKIDVTNPSGLSRVGGAMFQADLNAGMSPIDG